VLVSLSAAMGAPVWVSVNASGAAVLLDARQYSAGVCGMLLTGICPPCKWPEWVCTAWLSIGQRRRVLFKGESKRKRLAIPMFLGKVE
jgi:hypothetical protein